MSDDDKIIEQVDGWNEERLKNERQSARLKHERWMGVGGFFKKGIIVSLIGTGLWFGVPWVSGMWSERVAKDEAEREANSNAYAAKVKAEEEATAAEVKKEEKRLAAAKKAKRQRATEARATDIREADARTAAFVECIDTLGMKKCRLIQQHGLAQCGKRGGAENSLACINEHMSIRWGTLSQKEAETKQDNLPDDFKPEFEPESKEDVKKMLKKKKKKPPQP